MIFNRYQFIDDVYQKGLDDLTFHIANGIKPFASLEKLSLFWHSRELTWSKDHGDHDQQEHEKQNLSFDFLWGDQKIHLDLIVCLEKNEMPSKSLAFSYIKQICYGYFLQAENHHLETHVYQDDLTGVFNYRRLIQDLDCEVQNYEATSQPFCLVFVDIDDFKKVNDTYGHRTGSSLIQKLSDHLLGIMKNKVSIYRYGGDEFVFLCPGWKLENLEQLLKDLISSLKIISFPLPSGEEYKISLSMGVAEFPRHAQSPQELIDIADKMMYAAKKDDGGGEVLFPGHRKFAA